MFNKIASKMTTPFSVLPFDSMDGTGDTVYLAAVPYKCFPVHKLSTVLNTHNEEVLSKIQLYALNIDVDTSDAVMYNSKQYNIKAIDIYVYNGLKAVVVYI